MYMLNKKLSSFYLIAHLVEHELFICSVFHIILPKIAGW